ncbi:MAG: histidinol dehydrogenase [Planctomycetota bacterium]
MSNELDKILILPSHRDFLNRLEKLREKKAPTGRFRGYDSPESKQVLEIIREVAEEGEERRFASSDEAVAGYTIEFDNAELRPDEFKILLTDLKKAHKNIDKNLLASIRQSIENVKRYQKEIFIGKDQTCSGATGIKYTTIKRIGICVPGAAAPLPSTVIMTAVPAIVANVKPEDIVVVSPPRYYGSIHPATLAVCYELKITEVYRIGGAQAIAALASDKGTIPQVDKIVGPGSPWVQTAKKMVSQDYVAIDSIMGPSEVLIIANEKANPVWIAADMLSQAEHASDSSAVVLTDSEAIAKQSLEELRDQLGKLSRVEDTRESLLALSAIIVLNSMTEVIDLANDLASEHLEIQCGKESKEIAREIKNAGAIFIGDYSPVAVGDYWAGPSHTLPTEKRAKFSSALTSNDFVKSTSIIEYDKKQLADSAEDIIRLAEAEGLDAHAKSVRIRQQD